jgi:polyhydroxyalkanoate synthesis regulator protein
MFAYNRFYITQPESETLGDYSLLSLEAIAALIMELRIEKELLSERLDVLTKKIDDLNTAHKNSTYSLEKKIESLEASLSELEKRMIFLDSVETIIPRMNEVETRIERLPSEIMSQVDSLYGDKIDAYLNEYLEGRLKEFEKKLKEDIFGVSVNLAETLQKIQERYEELIIENMHLKKLQSENEKLRKELLEREKEVEELRRQVNSLRDVSQKIDALSQKVAAYQAKLEQMKRLEEEIKNLAGVDDVNLAIQMIKKQLVQKSKFEKTLREVKILLKDLEEIKEENLRLRKENERLRDALKMMLQEKLEGEERSSPVEFEGE